MILKKTKKDIIEAIKSASLKKKNEMFEINSKVQAVAPPSFVNALEMSAKNKQMVIDRMKEKEKERKELEAQTVERKANETPKTDAMKKMKMVKEFINESFKDKLTINENIFTVTTKLRTDLKKLIENARKHEVKYTIERINEEYRFNYKFEKLTESKKSKVDVKKCRDIMQNQIDWTDVDVSGDVHFAIDQVRSMRSENVISDDEYDYIISNWDKLQESKTLKEDIDDGHFWTLVFMKKGDDEEQVETYEDFDAVRSDFLYMTQEEPDNFEYVVFQEVTIEDDVENIEIIDEFREGEFLESKKTIKEDKKDTDKKADLQKEINWCKAVLNNPKGRAAMDARANYGKDYVAQVKRDLLGFEKQLKQLDESKSAKSLGLPKEVEVSIGQLDFIGDFIDLEDEEIRELLEEYLIYKYDFLPFDFDWKGKEDDAEKIICSNIKWDTSESLIKSKKTLKEGRLTGSKYKALIGEHFDHSFDFEFLDVVAETLDRIDFKEDLDDEIDVAINDALTYIEDQWIIAQFYVSSPAELDWNDVLEEFSSDISQLAEKIAEDEENEEDEEEDEV